MSSYQYFAQYYDILTSNIPYRKRGEYFHEIISKYKGTDSVIVELGCGTGSICEVMAEFGYDVIGVDNSEDMLTMAAAKRYTSGHDIMYLHQDMCELDLYGTADVFLCVLDSLNHLVESDDMQAVFDGVSTFLEPDGIFIFDVNTIYKHQNVLSNNTYIYDYDEVYCVWQNALSEDNVVDISLDLFCKQGKRLENRYARHEEHFSERAYSHEEIIEFIKKAKLSLIDYYAEDSFNKPTDTTQRVIYVVGAANN